MNLVKVSVGDGGRMSRRRMRAAERVDLENKLVYEERERGQNASSNGDDDAGG
jgi:hypothetical protein